MIPSAGVKLGQTQGYVTEGYIHVWRIREDGKSQRWGQCIWTPAPLPSARTHRCPCSDMSLTMSPPG